MGVQRRNSRGAKSLKATVVYYDLPGGVMQTDVITIPKQPLPGDVLEHLADKIRWTTNSIGDEWVRFEIVVEREG